MKNKKGLGIKILSSAIFIISIIISIVLLISAFTLINSNSVYFYYYGIDSSSIKLVLIICAIVVFFIKLLLFMTIYSQGTILNELENIKIEQYHANVEFENIKNKLNKEEGITNEE